MSYYHRKKWYRYKKVVLPPIYDLQGYLIKDPLLTDRPKRKIDISIFLKNEFLTCDKITFAKFSNLYSKTYGTRACSYMIRTYPGWKSGNVKITGLIAGRIPQFVPPYLSDEKRFLILKWEVQYYLDTIRYEHTYNKILISINDSYYQFERSIENFNYGNLSCFFIEKGFFSAEEIDQFVYACKYALIHKLKQSYDQVRGDISLIKSKIEEFKVVLYNGKYHIDFLNKTYDLNSVMMIEDRQISIGDSFLILSTGFKELTETYILKELLEISFIDKKAKTNGFINSIDLHTIFNEYNEGKLKKLNISILAKFQGFGGMLNLELKYVPNEEFYDSILLSIIRLILTIILTFVIRFIVIKYFNHFSQLFYITCFFISLYILYEINALVIVLYNLNKNGKKFSSI